MRIDLPAAAGAAAPGRLRPAGPWTRRRRARHIVAAACLVIFCGIGLLAGAGPSRAQGLFESLFGLKPAKPAAPLIYRGPRAFGNGAYAVRGSGGASNMSYPVSLRRPAPKSRRGSISGPKGSGNRPARRIVRYRTYCVRKCDGYYFPISFSVKRGRFYRDANACKSKCGEDARLYYVPGHGAPENMVNLRGLAYRNLKTAFIYRKKLLPGCRCKPQPWAQSEVDRHRGYALNEPPERRRARLAGDLRFLAGLKKKRKVKKAKALALATAPATKKSAVAGEGAEAAGIWIHAWTAGRFGTLPKHAFKSSAQTGEGAKAADTLIHAWTAGRFGTLPKHAFRLLVPHKGGGAATKKGPVRRRAAPAVVRGKTRISSGKAVRGRRLRLKRFRQAPSGIPRRNRHVALQRRQRQRLTTARLRAKAYARTQRGPRAKLKYRWPGD